MEKLNFLPLWEIERINKRKRKNSYITLFILMLFNSLLIIHLIINMHNIKKIKIENIYKEASFNKNFNDKNTQIQKTIDSLKSYQWYNKEISKEVTLKEIIIKDKEIILQAKVKDYIEYINIVSYIENKCKIKDISIAKFNESYLEFSLTLEANYE